MRKFVKIIVFILIVMAMATGVLIYYTQPMKVKTITTGPKVWEVSFKGKGEIINPDTVEYYSKNGGLISEARFEDKDIVAAGDILFRFDITDYENALKEGQNRIAALDGEKSQAEISLDQDYRKIDVEVNSINVQIEATLSQIRPLEIQISTQEEHLAYVEEIHRITLAQYELEGVSKNDLDNASMAVNDTKSAINTLHAQIDALNRQVDVLNQQRSLLQTMRHTDISGLLSRIEAEKRLIEDNIEQLNKKIDESVVIADCSGRLSCKLNQGQTVPAGTLLATIATQDQYQLESFVQLEDIGSLSIGSVVEATLVQSTGDTVFEAVIVDIESEAKNVPGYNNKRVRVVMEMDQDAIGSLSPGYSLNIRFVTSYIENCIVIPKSATIENRKGVFVKVIKSGVVVLKAVEKESENSASVLIRSGLVFGDIVVESADNEDIKEGQRVRIG